MNRLPTSAEIEHVREVIDPAFLDSPTMRHPALDEALGCACTLKVETINPIRSFKGRGTEAVMASLGDVAHGVITFSTGNFGQGVAWAARRRGIPATIVCPADVNPMKADAMRRLGASVRLADASDSGGDLKGLTRHIAAEENLFFIEDGGHVEIAAGAGTIAQELTEAEITPDLLVVQVGDGALAAGIGAWMRERSPRTRIIGVVAAGAPSLALSMEAGRPVRAPVDTIADGMAIGLPVQGAVDLLRQVIDEVLLVDDSAILEAMRLLANGAGLIAEPSGAAGIAALMAAGRRFSGTNVASIITGSNVHPHLLA